MNEGFTKIGLLNSNKSIKRPSWIERRRDKKSLELGAYQTNETIEQVNAFALDFKDPAFSQIGRSRIDDGRLKVVALTRFARIDWIVKTHSGALVFKEQTREQDAFKDLEKSKKEVD